MPKEVPYKTSFSLLSGKIYAGTGIEHGKYGTWKTRGEVTDMCIGSVLRYLANKYKNQIIEYPDVDGKRIIIEIKDSEIKKPQPEEVEE